MSGLITSSYREFLLFAFGPVDPIRLKAFRRWISVSLLFYITDRSLTPYQWLTEKGFHLSVHAQTWHTPYPAPLLPEWLVPIFLLTFIGCIIALIIGWEVRSMTWVVWLQLLYISFADFESSFTINKLYLVSFLVLALSSPIVSVITNKKCIKEFQSVWPIRVLQATILIQFGTAGWCKLFHGDWNLFPDTLWTHVQGLYCTDIAAWMLRTFPEWTWIPFMYMALGFEIFGPIILLCRKIRWVGIIWGLCFLFIIALTMYKLFFFSFQLACFFLLFMDEKSLYRLYSSKFS
ncbi:hypothetical protein MYX76_14355 [Desulfobacterota bacterium AH_259_B03_O07]|nr:hypothetical protein [Desulfobacterota bacterium AH_259_B03_O07]